MKDLDFCIHCGSANYVKRGKVFNVRKTTWKQQYYCKNCGIKYLGTVMHLAEDYEPDAFVYQDKPLPMIDWANYNLAQLNEKQLFLQLLNNVLDLFVFEPMQTTGRPTADINDMIYSMVIKAYSKNSSRRTVSDLKLLKELNFIDQPPCFTTIMKYYNDSRLTPILEKIVELSGLPLRDIEDSFSIDSSGFSTSVFARWFDFKHRLEKESRLYRKCHITIGTKTNIVTSIIITKQDGANSADVTQFKELLTKTAINFRVKEISADMAYLSRNNLETAIRVGAMPYVPFKSNTTGGNNGLIWRKLYLYFKENPQDFYERYHKRSNVESTFSMIKRKFGSSLMTKKYTANVNEILCKVICHNLCCLISAYYELNVEQALWTKAQETPKLSIKV